MKDTISRRAAIDVFQNLAYDDWNQGVTTSWADAYQECAEMIRELPSAQPDVPDTNVGDMISRQAAIDVVIPAMIDGADADMVEGLIHLLPSAQPDLQEYSVWFRIGETLVDVSKMHITAEEGIEKIRSYLMRMKKPERILCKECKYCFCGQCWKSDGLDKLDGNVADDDFCSRAERRE